MERTFPSWNTISELKIVHVIFTLIAFTLMWVAFVVNKIRNYHWINEIEAVILKSLCSFSCERRCKKCSLVLETFSRCAFLAGYFRGPGRVARWLQVYSRLRKKSFCYFSFIHMRFLWEFIYCKAPAPAKGQTWVLKIKKCQPFNLQWVQFCGWTKFRSPLWSRRSVSIPVTEGKFSEDRLHVSFLSESLTVCCTHLPLRTCSPLGTQAEGQQLVTADKQASGPLPLLICTWCWLYFICWIVNRFCFISSSSSLISACFYFKNFSGFFLLPLDLIVDLWLVHVYFQVFFQITWLFFILSPWIYVVDLVGIFIMFCTFAGTFFFF